MDKILQNIQIPLFEKVSNIADEQEIRLWLIGGFVRDVFLGRNSKDIDIVVLGDGVRAAEMLARHLKADNLSVFKNFGTAQMRVAEYEIEIVGARKESYQTDSRKPDVEAGSIEDDQNRRDFTIDAMAVSLNRETFGEFT